MDDNYDIKNLSQKKSCSNAFAIGCKSCARLPGIPLFPIRYTACSISGNEAIPTLPNNIISTFTSITLDQYIDNNEKIQTTLPLNKYIFRKLRKGYLYIYDEAYGGQWQCFGIYPSGELTAFAPETPIPLPSLQSFSCKNPDNNYISSILTIPNAGSRNIYVAYVEYPWSMEHIDRLKTDSSMRKSCMQEFKITTSSDEIIALNGGLIRSHRDITQYLPEYNSKYSKYAAGTIDIKLDKDQKNLLYFKTREEEETTIERALFSVSDDIQSHPGLVIVIHDEVDLIEQLNAAKHQPHDELKRKAMERPDGQGLRELYWLQAVQKLEEGISNQFKNEAQKERDKSTPAEHEKFIKDVERVTKDYYSNNYTSSSPYEYSSYEGSSFFVCLHEQDAAAIEMLGATVSGELKKYYDTNKKKLLEDYFNPCFKNIENSKFILDANYCDWIKFSLERTLIRYDTTNLEHSKYIVEILGSLLDGGSILSINSQKLWQWIHEESTKSRSSILARGICLNNDKILENYDIQELKSNADEFKSNETPNIFTDTLKIKNWYDLVKKGQKLYEKRGDIKTKELTTPLNAWKAGWKDFWKPYNQLRQALATSRIALYQQHVAQLKMNQEIKWAKGLNPYSTIKQLQITSAIESAILDEPLEDYSFGIIQTKASPEDVMKTIKKNNSAYSNNTITPHYYHPSAFQTGDKKISNKASGNFSFITNKISFPKAALTTAKKLYNNEMDFFSDLSFTHKINYSAIIDLNSDIPEQILSDDEKILIAEQEKVAEAWTKGKASIIFANLIMSFINMKNAIDALSKDDVGLEEWWKVIGTSIAALQATNDIRSNITSYRSANALRTIDKLDLAKEANRLKFNANFLGKSVAIIGIIDALITFAKAFKKYKNGGTARDMYIETAIGTLSLAGSVATLVAGSAVLTPILLSLIIIIIGLNFLLTHLVPKNIENWLRRSLYGKDQETVKGKVFRDMETEQSALQMVLRGITVDINLKNATLVTENENRYETYQLDAEITYPANLSEEIIINILGAEEKTKIALIKKDIHNDVNNEFFLEKKIEGQILKEKDVSKITIEKSEKQNKLIIFYILGSNRDDIKNGVVEFDIKIGDNNKRDSFYVSV